MPESLQKECSRTPVTALAVQDGLIFSAQGISLLVHDEETCKLLASARIFDDQIIHGIEIRRTEKCLFLLVWGGQHLSAVIVESVTGEYGGVDYEIRVVVQNSCTLPDWILDVVFQPAGSDLTDRSGRKHGKAVLVTANNVLYQVNISGDFDVDFSITQIQVGRRCILYSAHLKWCDSTTVMVASGTAFGEIVVWSCSTDIDSNSSFRPLLVLTGHEGSIFGVQISDLVELEPVGGEEQESRLVKLRLLTSCSDDRTIRVWDITNLTPPVSPASSNTEIKTDELIHATGFAINDDSTSKDRCLAVAMGHVSRIWSVRYAYNAPDQLNNKNMLGILSFGEDATCQRWILILIPASRQEPSGRFGLKHMETESHHAGKNIWAVALIHSKKQLRSHYIVTGGADARIISSTSSSRQLGSLSSHWDIQDVISANSDHKNEMEATTERKALVVPPKRNKDLPDCFRSYAFINDDTILVTTNVGLILLASRIGSEVQGWQWDQHTCLDDLKGYSVACSFDDSGYAILGTASGAVYVFNFHTLTTSPLITVKGKVAGLFTQQPQSKSSNIRSLLVTSQGSAAPQLLFLRICGTSGLELFETVPVAVDSFSLSPATITSFICITTRDGEDRVFLGCRDGDILLSSAETGFQTITLRRAHGKEAVTSLHWTTEPENPENLGWLLSVGRDGTLTIHEVSLDGREPKLVHKLALPFGPNIEGIYVHPQTNEVCIYGFHGKDFVVHNVSSAQDIMTAECGGAHRVWKFKPRFNSKRRLLGGIFAWTKASKLNVSGSYQPNHRIIKHGSHGREIKACAVASVHLPGLSVRPLIATGAEDTEIRLSCYSEGNFHNLSVIRKHVTGIQSLQWSSDGRFLFSCGGYEEFFVWRLQAVPGVLAGVVCESSCPLEVVRSDLRIMNFAVRYCGSSETEDTGVSSTFVITMAYSNSVIKLWRYTSTKGSGSWDLLATARYTSACITQIMFLDCSDHITLLTAATDGHLAIWTGPNTYAGTNSSSSKYGMADQLTCIRVQRLHQNSIKSLSTQKLNTTTILIFTSGDDNALGVSLITSASKTSLPEISSLLIPRAHAANINASSILSARGTDAAGMKFEVRALSASNDQRVKLWNISVDLAQPGIAGVEAQKAGSRYSAVADISDMTVFPDKDDQDGGIRVLISGVGMEVWKVGHWKKVYSEFNET